MVLGLGFGSFGSRVYQAFRLFWDSGLGCLARTGSSFVGCRVSGNSGGLILKPRRRVSEWDVTQPSGPVAEARSSNPHRRQRHLSDSPSPLHPEP